MDEQKADERKAARRASQELSSRLLRRPAATRRSMLPSAGGRHVRMTTWREILCVPAARRGETDRWRGGELDECLAEGNRQTEAERERAEESGLDRVADGAEHRRLRPGWR